jgi:SPP1 family predicted phage head-tail adaptor
MRAVLQSISPVALQGRFRHRIQIAKPSTVFDTFGGSTLNNPTILYTIWGTVEALSGVEKFAAHEFTSQVTHAIYIRNPRSLGVAITANMLVLWNGHTYQIEAVLDPDNRGKYLQLLVIEINDSAQQPASASESSL